MTFGPSAVSIRPQYSTPAKGVPSLRMPASTGSTTVRITRSTRAASTSGLGASAPIPPVLGPSSLSKARLWSCADPIGRPRVPSHNAKNDTSGPTRHSSMTTVLPAAPKVPCRMAASTAARASSTVVATVTPLPAASPSALTTTGAPNAATAASAWSAVSQMRARAVGTPWRSMNALE